MAIAIKHLADRVIVQPMESETMKGGIIIPDTAKEKPSEGEIVATGPGARNEDGEIKHLRVMNIGDLCGEVGPLAGGQRTADVVALEDSQLLVLSWGRIDRLTRRFPILAFRLFRNLTRIIGARPWSAW